LLTVGARRELASPQVVVEFDLGSDQTDCMAYTVQQARTHVSRLLKEAEAGKQVVIARGTKPAVRLVPILAPAQTPREPLKNRVLGRSAGKYAGQFSSPDDVFKPLETDEEPREYSFDLLVDGKESVSQ